MVYYSCVLLLSVGLLVSFFSFHHGGLACILSTACFPFLSLLVMHIDLCSAWLPSTSFPNPHTFKVSYYSHWDCLKLFSSDSSSPGQRTAVFRLPSCLEVWLVSKPWIKRGRYQTHPFPVQTFAYLLHFIAMAGAVRKLLVSHQNPLLSGFWMFHPWKVKPMLRQWLVLSSTGIGCHCCSNNETVLERFAFG